MPSKPLSRAIADSFEGKNSGSRVPRLFPISSVRANGDVIVGANMPQGKIASSKVFMVNDQPQQAGTMVWTLRTDDGQLIGLGRG